MRKLGLLMIIVFLLAGNGVLAAEAPVKNVIVLMVDGCGSSHTTLARWYKNGPLALDEMVVGGIRTYSAESAITDSAPAATAFATGHKSNSKFIGVLPAATATPGLKPVAAADLYKPAATVLEGARLAGKATGIIATSNIQHASPAGYSAHWPDRGNYNEIAEQQVYGNIDVVLGAGLTWLLPKEKGGARADGEDLTAVLKAKGYALVTSRDQLAAVKSSKVWGMFAAGDMAYEIDRPVFASHEPSLAEMTKKAIELLARNPKGFFLFVEGSKVDWASHANDPVGVISDVLAFDDAVKVALDFAKKDGNTLVLAFSDHGNGGMSIGNKATNKNYDRTPVGYYIEPLRQASLTGEGVEKMLAGDLSDSNIRLTVFRFFGVGDLSDAEVAAIQKAKKGEMNYVLGPIISGRAGIGWTTNGHTGEDLFLYAYGPNRPSGLIENSEIARITAWSLGFNLADADRRLFVEAQEAMGRLGGTARVDWTDKNNPVLLLEKGGVRAELPFSKNLIKIGKQVIEMDGLTVLAPVTGKAYIPRQALDIITSAYQHQ